MVINQNTLTSPKSVIKSAKNFMKNISLWRHLQKLLLLNFLVKTGNRKKIYDERFKRCEAKLYLDGIIKFLNSYTNNKCSANDSLTAEFYIHFSNEIASHLLDVCDYWGKLDTMGVTSRTGIIFAIYKNGDEKDIENSGPISFLKGRL